MKWAYERLAVLIGARREEEPRADALSILCHTTDETGDRLSTEEIVGELHGFFSAGFETSAMTMSVALLPFMGGPSASYERPGAGDVDSVIQESERLAPVVPLTLPRRAVNEVTVGGTRVPAGALVFASALLEHRDPAVFPSPLTFRLDRPAPRPYEFFPFGLGPRRCLGAEFAEAQVHTTLSLLVARGILRAVTTEVGYGTVNGVVAGPSEPIVVDTAVTGAAPAHFTGGITRVWQA